jgi:hypothetical protein
VDIAKLAPNQIQELLEAEDQALSQAQSEVSRIRQRIYHLEFFLAEHEARHAKESARNQ